MPAKMAPAEFIPRFFYGRAFQIFHVDHLNFWYEKGACWGWHTVSQEIRGSENVHSISPGGLKVLISSSREFALEFLFPRSCREILGFAEKNAHFAAFQSGI